MLMLSFWLKVLLVTTGSGLFFFYLSSTEMLLIFHQHCPYREEEFTIELQNINFIQEHTVR